MDEIQADKQRIAQLENRIKQLKVDLQNQEESYNQLISRNDLSAVGAGQTNAAEQMTAEIENKNKLIQNCQSRIVALKSSIAELEAQHTLISPVISPVITISPVSPSSDGPAQSHASIISESKQAVHPCTASPSTHNHNHFNIRSAIEACLNPNTPEKKSIQEQIPNSMKNMASKSADTSSQDESKSSFGQKFKTRSETKSKMSVIKHLAEFAWTRSTTAPTPSSATAALLARHARSRVMLFRKQLTGGVLPVCVDEASQAWCLLGENHRSELCHFHGWIERGETFEMGTAREAFEESKGILGDVLTLWCAICQPSFYRRSGSIVMMSLGTLTQKERDAMCDDFVSRPVLYRGMAEVERVWWVPMRQLRQLCVGDDSQTCDCDSPGPASLLPPGLKLRDFLLGEGWMGDEGLWDEAVVQDLVDTGIIPDDWLRLQDLPRLNEGEAAYVQNCLAEVVDTAMPASILAKLVSTSSNKNQLFNASYNTLNSRIPAQPEFKPDRKQIRTCHPQNPAQIALEAKSQHKHDFSVVYTGRKQCPRCEIYLSCIASPNHFKCLQASHRNGCLALTKLCNKFPQCHPGCTFAHGEQEIRRM
jgi:hypothetical protein